MEGLYYMRGASIMHYCICINHDFLSLFILICVPISFHLISIHFVSFHSIPFHSLIHLLFSEHNSMHT